MAKYKFSHAQRYAVFTIHGPKCYICYCPIDLQTMEIDHIVPESLADNSQGLSEALASLTLPSDFNVNSYENWLPSCGGCNRKKSDSVFEPSLLITMELKRAASKANKVQAAADDILTNRAASIALGKVFKLVEGEALDDETLGPLVDLLIKKNPNLVRGRIEIIGPPDDVVGFGGVGARRRIHIPAEIRLTPFHTVLFEDKWKLLVKAPYGVGYQPKAKLLDGNLSCGNCGSFGPWSGARCLSCGHLDDD